MKTNKDPWKKGNHANLIEACKLDDIIPIQCTLVSIEEMFCVPLIGIELKGSKKITVLLKPKFTQDVLKRFTRPLLEFVIKKLHQESISTRVNSVCSDFYKKQNCPFVATAQVKHLHMQI
jgi:hypothetical protein